MMQQYQSIRRSLPKGTLLLFRLGDFYELFFDDAKLAANILGVALTKRNGMPMCGVPFHAAEAYIGKLIKAGLRVAICDQISEPQPGKIVERKVSQIISPGTVSDLNLLESKQNNFLAAINQAKNRYGLALIDVSTGEFRVAEMDHLSALQDELARFSPTELIRPDTMDGLTEGTVYDGYAFEIEQATELLREQFQVQSLDGFGCGSLVAGVGAAGAIIHYLKNQLRRSTDHIRSLGVYLADEFVALDATTHSHLELVGKRDDRRDTSLLRALDRTVTPMGARLLQEWIVAPLAERAAIDARLDAVGELRDEHAARLELRSTLGSAYDLQRLTARVSTGRASPRDLRSVARTLALLPRVKAKVTARQSALLRDLESRLELCPDLRELLESALVDDPPLSAREGGVIRRGYDANLDELHQTVRGAKEWMARYQAEQITRTGIPSLKVGFTQNMGYYIEVTHTHSRKIPADYLRERTYKNAERYSTPELKEQAEKVLTAEGRIVQLEYDLFAGLRDRVAAQTGRLLQTAEVLAALDVLTSLAELSAERGYHRPELRDEPIIEIADGKHPVLEQILPPGTFVPNDTTLGGDAGFFLLVTGPNMGGKSVYLRQTALIVLMAQMGSFVPARRAVVGLVDRIFTRVGASDELNRQQSTFMVEMTEAANILNNATPRSLVILDEIGRGTSTYDGVSLAWGITEYLHDKIGCRTLFATHYHELAQLADKLPGLRNANALVHEDKDGIIFLHKMAPGSADKSYGIHVAQRAGVPAEVLSRAREVLAELEAHHLKASETHAACPIRNPKLVQPSLFANSDDPILQELRALDVTKMTPEEIAAQVRRWQRELRP